MREAGSALMALGVTGFAVALFFLPTTVSSGLGGEVVNLDLQQRQLLVAIGSAAIFLAGTVLYAAGSALARIAPPLADPVSQQADAATMERLGITRQSDGYKHGNFVYNRLVDAVRAAERS